MVPTNTSHRPSEGGYGRYVGRVGALAVALGIGIAVANSPGIALADTAGSGSPGSRSSTADSKSSQSSTRDSAPTRASTRADDDSGDTSAPTPDGDNSDGADDQGADDAPPKPAIDDTDHTDDTDEPESDSDTDAPGETAEDRDESAPPESEDDSAAPVDESDPSPAENRPDSDTAKDATKPDDMPATSTPERDNQTTENDSPTDESDRSPVEETADADTSTAVDDLSTTVEQISAVSDTKPTDAVVVDAPQASDESLVAAPVGFVAGAVSALLSWTGLNPLAANNPVAPPEPPALWALLSWVRREIQHTFFNRTPTIAYNPTENSQSVDGVITGDLNASDEDGDELSYTVVTQPENGSLVVNDDGTFTYTPDPDLAVDGLTDNFVVKVEDEGFHLHGLLGFLKPDWGHSTTTTIGLTVEPTNEAPTFDNITVGEPDAYNRDEVEVVVVVTDGDGDEVHLEVGLDADDLNKGSLIYDEATGTILFRPSADAQNAANNTPPESPARYATIRLVATDEYGAETTQDVVVEVVGRPVLVLPGPPDIPISGDGLLVEGSVIEITPSGEASRAVQDPVTGEWSLVPEEEPVVILGGGRQLEFATSTGRINLRDRATEEVLREFTMQRGYQYQVSEIANEQYVLYERNARSGLMTLFNL